MFITTNAATVADFTWMAIPYAARGRDGVSAFHRRSRHGRTHRRKENRNSGLERRNRLRSELRETSRCPGAETWWANSELVTRRRSKVLEAGRSGIADSPPGIATRAFEEARSYAPRTRPFGKKIAVCVQAFQWMFADMAYAHRRVMGVDLAAPPRSRFVQAVRARSCEAKLFASETAMLATIKAVNSTAAMANVDRRLPGRTLYMRDASSPKRRGYQRKSNG